MDRDKSAGAEGGEILIEIDSAIYIYGCSEI